MTPMQQYFLQRCKDGIQFMEELGGPEAEDYVDVMEALKRDIEQRIRTCKVNNDLPL